MNGSSLYAIAAGGIFLVCFLVQARTTLTKWAKPMSVLFSQHLALPVLLRRHRTVGPWSRLGFLAHVTYVAINGTVVFFRPHSLSETGRRAGELALVNLMYPLTAAHLGSLADHLGISWRTCCQIHRATGWMSIALLSFHIIVEVQREGFTFPLDHTRNLFTLIGTASIGFLVLLSLARVRRWSYEIFLRGHQLMTGIFIYGIWRHLPNHGGPPKLYLYVGLATLVLNTGLGTVSFLYRNGLFSGHGTPRAVVSFSPEGTFAHPKSRVAILIRVVLPRPIKFEAGQYVNLWMPSMGWWSWTQTHPFIVTSWSRGNLDSIALLVQPRRGMTADLLRLARGASGHPVSFPALFTGPHGTSQSVDQYETVLLIATGFGIAATIPYLKKMIHGHNTCTLQVRRIHLVWQVETLDMVQAAESLLNPLLQDDILDKGYILHISIYVANGLAQDKTPIGRHQRACYYQGTPDYENILAVEASGDRIERLPGIQDEQGRTLVMVSAAEFTRDNIRKNVRQVLHHGVELMELEYQPS